MRDYLKNHVCTEKTNEEPIEEITKKDLIKLAKESGIKGSDRMSKEDLLEALK